MPIITLKDDYAEDNNRQERVAKLIDDIESKNIERIKNLKANGSPMPLPEEIAAIHSRAKKERAMLSRVANKDPEFIQSLDAEMRDYENKDVLILGHNTNCMEHGVFLGRYAGTQFRATPMLLLERHASDSFMVDVEFDDDLEPKCASVTGTEYLEKVSHGGWLTPDVAEEAVKRYYTSILSDTKGRGMNKEARILQDLMSRGRLILQAVVRLN